MNQYPPWTPEEDKVLLAAKSAIEAYRLLNKHGSMRSRLGCRMRRERLLGMRNDLRRTP